MLQDFERRSIDGYTLLVVLLDYLYLPEERQELESIRRRKQELLQDIQRLKDEIADVTNEIENLGLTEERKSMQRNKQMAIGRKKFNMDPTKGIRFLIDSSLLKNTSEDIAQFLYKGEGLNKTAIGDYLGERCKINGLNKYFQIPDIAFLPSIILYLSPFFTSFHLFFLPSLLSCFLSFCPPFFCPFLYEM
uniref:SEC7 domain-containing protein n=1 Tax=Poecilia latipinna TaxID=48699 RepID=A0A3B3V434_9TELE